MGEQPSGPQWCIVGNLLPYPYSPRGSLAAHRSQKIFPAGAKLYVIGGFAGMGYETVTVIGHAHRRRRPVLAHLKAAYVGGWRAELVYRPVLLRMILRAQREQPRECHRWLNPPHDGRQGRYEPHDPAYGEHLARIAASFRQTRTGSR
ncbi:hypothetical protein F6X54_31015 [Micromonospora aurantiaca]|uniref:Uncharacterized protein n=1 Tax=Micromonospora aurantiaca (nom. illeg.) TaxID=47850 RepID=A0ABQ6U7C0_9ACTN|nr:hypothetical protein [Micromonospora aurantiaca]KAB1102705.1 hypothetical protein F6X54_31015 [Micromonospora aurantiaca]